MSNKASFLVTEVLDLTVSQLQSGPVLVAAGETDRAVAFRLTNTGNGREAFGLTASVLETAAAPSVTLRIGLDRDDDGRFDPLRDALIEPGVNDPVLNADRSATIFLLASAPAGLPDGFATRLNLSAAARTGAGRPGLALPGRGDAGADVVVGASGGQVNAEAKVLVASARADLSKEQTIADPTGGSQPVRGAVITYQVTARVRGQQPLLSGALTDNAPIGTSYIPGTLKLDGAPLSDAADADAGRVSGRRVEVALGELQPGRERRVTFKTRID